MKNKKKKTIIKKKNKKTLKKTPSKKKVVKKKVLKKKTLKKKVTRKKDRKKILKKKKKTIVKKKNKKILEQSPLKRRKKLSSKHKQIIIKKINDTPPIIRRRHIAKRLDANKFKFFEDILLAKRQDILSLEKEKEREIDLSLGDVGDDGDIASQTFEREMIFEFTNAERRVLDDIEAALRKIERREFGICESCKSPIAEVRLKAMPWARYCIVCQSRLESS